MPPPLQTRLLYSNVAPTNVDPACCNVFSVGLTAGSEHTYPAENFVLTFAGNLPDGKLFAAGFNYGTLASNLATVDVAGSVTPFYQFPAGSLPANPIYGADGNYYGTFAPSRTATTTSFYKVTPSGSFTQVAALPFVTTAFDGAGLVLQGSDGNFYGIQSTGLGCSGSNPHGGVYKLTPAGQYTLLHDFGVCGNGIVNWLIQASDGKLYGAIEGNSEIFSLTTSGEYAVVFQPTNPNTQGTCPCWLLQGSDGIIYGVAQSGGPRGDGLVFALDAGLPAPLPQAQQFTPTVWRSRDQGSHLGLQPVRRIARVQRHAGNGRLQ
jgi:hypothetical protein